MRNIKKILTFVAFLAIFVMFTGAVSAADWTVNPGNSIQGVSDNDTVIVNGNGSDNVAFQAVNSSELLDPNDLESYEPDFAVTVSSPVVNVNTGKGYSGIQAAVSDSSTLNGHVIEVNSGTYIENIFIYKNLTLLPSGDVMIQALDPGNCAINIDHSGVVISGFTIIGVCAPAILIYGGAADCYIMNNTVDLIYEYGDDGGCYEYYGAIHLDSVTNCTITGNTITSQYMDGIQIHISNNISISNNNVTGNDVGIVVGDSEGIVITGNNISNNIWGLDIYYSSVDVHFNRIVDNSEYGLLFCNGLCDATNNWWGTNDDPIWSWSGNNIYIYGYDEVFYDPWLVLTLTGSNVTDNGTSDSVITADLTHNCNGEDTSSQGHVPDGIPVNFYTDLGTITTIAYTSNGKANATFNRGPNTSGIATIIATLDWETYYTGTVIWKDLLEGTYNTTRSVTLTVLDNLDPNPILYYSLNNGTTWFSQIKSVTINLTEGITNIKYYSRNLIGNTYTNQTITYTIDTTPPTVNAHPVGGIYNNTLTVTLTASDNLDSNPVIYYTTNGSTPTTSSARYINPINIISTTTLKFIAVDNAGNQGPVNIKQYNIERVSNLNTGRGYSNIQEAIDDSLTVDGDVLLVRNGTYIENVLIYKNLTLISGGDVKIQALYPGYCTIEISHSGVVISGFTIIGVYAPAVYIYGDVSDCQIINNTISVTSDEYDDGGCYEYYGAIHLDSVTNCTITGNTITSQYLDGIHIHASNGIVISNNSVTGNDVGIVVGNSEGIVITGNNISNNIWGLDIYHSIVDVNFNRIADNFEYGLRFSNGLCDATNNWWGTNDDPTWSWSGNNIYIYGYGEVFYDPWLVLTLTGSKVTDNGTSDSVITADLTHNSHGEDTSSQGHVPDGIPINFFTDLGTITAIAYTSNGKANANFNRGPNTSGAATVVVTLDGEIYHAYAPILIQDLFGGSYNTTKSLTLTVLDDFDPNPIIYYSLDNGTTWNNQIKSVTINLTEGITNIKWYAQNILGNTYTRTQTYTIDLIAPTVNANPGTGIYNTTKSVTLTGSDNFDLNLVIYYSLDNGITWNSYVRTVTLNLGPGVTHLKFYARDNAGNACLNQTITYTIDATAPTVIVSPGTGVYNTMQIVNLTASDNIDSDPVIYYTLDGSTPTTSSTRYTGPITITSTTALKFIAVDFVGNESPIGTRYYIFSPVGNINTGRGYSNIQEAIDDPLTVDGDVLFVGNGTYVENIVIYKNLTLISGGDVVIQALNPLDYLITINHSGVVISGFTLIGGGAPTIYIPYVSYEGYYGVADCHIINNTVTDMPGNYGVNFGFYYSIIVLDGAINCTITGNTVTGNYIADKSGILIRGFSNNIFISNNTVTGNYVGIKVVDSEGIVINGNNINNNIRGLDIYYSSTDLHFNRIADNFEHGLLFSMGLCDATNNWWGTNYPSLGSDIYIYGDGELLYDPWLVLTLTGSNVTDNGTSDSVITADLTHNSHGEDTSSQGHVPDGIPVNFTTDLGTITTTAYTKNGKANATFNRGPNTSGTVTITAIVDWETYYTRPPTVTSNPVGGTYNTTKSVTLTVLDNLDPNPIIYYSLDNGITWFSQIKSVTINLTEGITNIKYYAVNLLGNTYTNQTITYTIDLTAPIVTANLVGGVYNTTKSVTLTGSDNLDSNPVIYYSLDNGLTWNSYVKTVTLNLSQGVTHLKFYARDNAGNTCLNQTITYTIDLTAPTVTANPAGGVYNPLPTVTLTATDNLDSDPVIYYTTNGSAPTTSSTRYTNPIHILSTTTLKFIAVDNAGNQGPVNIQQYILGQIKNINTGKSYSSIQDAIDDNLTLNGHIIEVSSGIYKENVVVNKNLTIVSVGNVTVQALSSSDPVFTVNSAGSNSVIQGFIMKGFVELDNADNCRISGNIINGNNDYAIYLYNHADNNVITGNTLNSGYCAVSIWNSFNNQITSNDLNMPSQSMGIFAGQSTVSIIGNSISWDNGGVYGIYLSDSSANINFNRIIIINRYGLYNVGNGTVNATNNWWGSNNTPQIYNNGGTVSYDPWLVLNVNAKPSSTNNISTVTADLTHNNNGQDTSSQGHVPDGIPVDFFTDLGTITTTAYTSNGKANNTFTRGSTGSGTALVEALLDKQLAYTNITIDTVAPTVSSTDPANGAVNVPGDKVIKVTFNENIKAGSLWIELYTGSYSTGTFYNFTTSISGKVLTIDPTTHLKGNKYTICLHTGSILDLSGNPFALKSFNFNTINDTAVPTISSTDPANGAVNVPVNKVIKVTFNENIKAGNLWIELYNRVSADERIDIPKSMSINGKVLTVTPSNFLKGNGLSNRYILCLHTGSILDLSDNPFALTSFSFYTVNDTVAPTVSSTDPANGAVNVPGDKVIKVTFNENIKAGSLWIELYTGSYSTGTFYNFTTSINGKVLTIDPTSFLKGKYTLSLHTGSILDLSDNPLALCGISFYTQNAIYNNQSRKSFNSIQDAINDNLTLKGHVIEVSSGTYTENVVVNKKLTIVSNGNVKVQALNSSKPVFTINRSGSGSLIQGFFISGSVNNSMGLFLNGSSNCTIAGNNITNNYFGIGTTNTRTENNIIIYNIITLNQGNGLAFRNSHNSVIYGNTITDNNLDGNNLGGVILVESNNSTIHSNLIMGNAGFGISISDSNNTLIQNNLIPGNMFGLYIEGGENCKIYENSITEGIMGIYVYYSSADINFNRITENSEYELYNEYGTVNATNNWWGSNEDPTNSYKITTDNGYTYYNPWLVLRIDPTPPTNSGGKSSITADLTHNNLGEDTSSQGHVINGIPTYFTTYYGTITKTARTIKGQATTILNLGSVQPRNVTVSASLDDQTVYKHMTIAPGVATVKVTSTALDSTSQPINLTYTIPLNNSVTWLSVLWKNKGLFTKELQIIINGTVVKSKIFINQAYNVRKNSYRENVFNAVAYANTCILQDGMNPNTIPASFWNDLSSLFSLTSTELQFIKNHRLEFIDNLTVNLTYPGVVAPAITVTDPEINHTLNLNFTGNVIHRTSQIVYMDGLFSAGYEGVKSFAIATTKVDDDILDFWLDQYSTYPVGAMKAAYGTFLTALIMEYVHDQVADAAATEFNVTWARTSPIIVSVGDDALQTYMTLECDHSMGMTVVGAFNNMWMFNYVCSSTISLIEYAVMDNIGYGQINTVSTSVNSVMLDLIYGYLNNNASLKHFIQNGYIIFAAENYENFLAIDLETGILRDINIITSYYGAYCFHDGLTNLIYGQGENFIQKKEYININIASKLVGSVVKTYTGVETISFSTLFLGVAPPLGTIAGVSGIIVGSIQVGRGFYQYYDAVFNTPWTTSRSYEEQLNEDWHEWFRNSGPW